MKVAAAQDEELKRDKLIDSWVMVAGKQLGASRIGRMVEKDVTGPGLAETVRPCFELKATATLATRLSSILGDLRWAKEDQWPPTEASVFAYLVECAGAETPASRAQRLVETMGFMQGTLGFEMREILESKRISGFAAKQARRLGVRSKVPACRPVRMGGTLIPG
eukprot:6327446-Karenia_brevis.AAC.1